MWGKIRIALICVASLGAGSAYADPMGSPLTGIAGPTDTGEALRFMRCYKASLEPADRIAACRQLIKDKGITTAPGYVLGQIYLEQNDLAAARGLYEQMIATVPGDPSGYELRGIYFAIKGDYAAALKDADTAAGLAFVPQYPQAARCIIRAIAGKEMDAGLADCEAALDRDLGNESLRQSLCFILFRMGRMTDASAACATALKLDRRNAGALYVKSLAERAQGNGADADQDLESARRVDPHIADLYALYGAAAH